MLSRPLSEQQRELLSEERRCLADLRIDMAKLQANEEDQRSLERAIRQLDEPFLLVVVGEFNSGKSTFINALLGQSLLEEGVTPTTRRLHVLIHAAAAPPDPELDLEVSTANAEWLRDVRVVDTPGTNAIAREHEVLTRSFVPRADLVLFVTSADRPFTESERSFLASIREWGKKVTIVLNKIDILESPDEVNQVTKFVTESARELLDSEPDVRPISARRALRSKLDGAGGDEAAPSGFQALEKRIEATLEETERVRLKLLNPIGVASRLVGIYAESVRAALQLLSEDVEALADVERQLDAYREDLSRDFRFRLADVDNTLHEFESRGIHFFDETLRLGRVFDLLNKEKIQADFERDVVGEAPRQIEQRVDEIIDWLVGSDMRQWRAIGERLESRTQHHADRVVGRVAGALENDRARLLETLGRAARQTVDRYDRVAEASRMAESVRTAVAGAALLGAGAVGLGTAVTMLATTTAADVTGILAASTLAVVGLFVIPTRRHRAKRELRKRIAQLRRQLSEAIGGQFEREVDRGVQRIRESVGPYDRFVRSERERLEALSAALEKHEAQLAGLRRRVEAL